MQPLTAAAVQVAPAPGPPFGHLADRNLDLIRRHAGLLLGEGATAFRHGAGNTGSGSGPEPAG
jgi:hypothetical protein